MPALTHTREDEVPTNQQGIDWQQYSLLNALRNRRSRRFALGMRLNGGPLTFSSRHLPIGLTIEQQAALVYAGSGITGPTLAELPYSTGMSEEAGSGNIIVQLIGRTVASADSLHCISLVVIDDEGTWLVKRPQDFDRAELPAMARMGQEGRLVELYEHSRVKLADGRIDVPRKAPYVPPFNKWSANVPGSTYFLPIAELTALYINVLLSAFDDEFAYFVLDERKNFRPAGLAKFAKSRGGKLNDSLASERVATIGALETWMYEFAALEQGGVLQSLGLATQALGLGGFPHFAAHPYIWFKSLGFRMEDIPFSRTIGASPVMKAALRATKRDMAIPTAVGLERDGKTLIKPYCPPYYRNMREAVLAYVDFKFGANSGTLRDGGATSLWKDGSSVQSGIPKYPDYVIEATIAYCEYVYETYGRFPACSGPFRTVLAYQAHNLDPDFYETFYQPGALTDTQHAVIPRSEDNSG